jgi:hypothetical protein
MNFINFPESNLPLHAGKGNENTVSIRVMVCEHPEYQSNPTFYAGKFEFSDEEKEYIRAQMLKELLSVDDPNDLSSVLNAAMEALPELWLTSMHSWCPLILSVAHPFEMGYKKIILNRPT